ncbi:MAG: YlxR family protein [Chloroflexota bacterium]|nr:MAG: YlxR family protein [Chloroflexota bacterium]
MPTRSCVACRTARPKRELLRVVRTPGGGIVADESGRLSGRGAYVCRDLTCITTALNRGALSRALQTPVPEELRDELFAKGPSPQPEGGAHGQE